MQCICENWEFIFFHLHFFLFTTLQGILSYALKGFFHINTFLGRGLKVWNISLWCTPSSSFFLWNLENQRKATCWIWSQMVSKSHERGGEGESNNFKERHTTLLFPPSTSTLFPRTTNGKFSGSEGLACRRFLISSPQLQFFFHLRSHRRICKWSNLLKSLEIQIANLNKEFFSPVVKVVKWLHWINIIYKNTAISTTVEGNTKALESFLASCIPDLIKQKNRFN